jgi:mono/diheme cytochrome c family protein
MKRSSLLLLIGVTIAGTAIAATVSILHDGLSSRAAPTAMEVALARNVRHLAIPSAARTAQNPLLDSAEDLRDARRHFADHCAVCHANDGSGDSMMGNGLYPKPPDLRRSPTQELSDGELFWIIENGVRFTGMPAFASPDHGGQVESWKLVHFIRHLPHLTPAERIEMEEYNPKGPDERTEEEEENNFLNGATRQQKPGSQNHH